MKVAILGGTGFVGRALTEQLINNGHQVMIISRNKHRTEKRHLQYVQLTAGETSFPPVLEEVDAFINLAGERINGGLWTKKRKQQILDSRLGTTNMVVRIIQQMKTKPKVLINASAVGFYGTSETATFTETNHTPGKDFLARTVKKWEDTALQATTEGVRTVFCRFGIILSRSGGALPTIALPYHFFAGGTVGSGQQWVSWIHLKDVVRGILFLLKNKEIEGAVNFTAPNPEKMKDFGQHLGRALRRPHWLPVPAFLLKTVLGEMSVMVLEGQKVLPAKLTEYGFRFQYPELKATFEDIYH